MAILVKPTLHLHHYMRHYPRNPGGVPFLSDELHRL